MIRILIVDTAASATDLGKGIAKPEHIVTIAHACSEALTVLKTGEADVVILGMKLPDGEGVELLGKIKALYPLTQVIMIVGHASVDAAIQSMKLGAYDCFTKPIRPLELAGCVQKAYEAKRFREERLPLSGGKLGSAGVGDEFAGESNQIQEVRKLISCVAPSRTSVLILGETGTGKELVARAIHKASERSKGPFIAINATSLPESILESELFGYKRGAFTGAQSDKEGLLEMAHGGTFFIDEVGDMDLSIQAKLLRVVERGTFRKLGSTQEIRVDVRFVSATNKDLEKESSRNFFRADLFYRLSTFIIQIPPLRERKDDIPLLIDYFLSKMARGEKAKHLSSEALTLLVDYSWPGNVRELSNMLERAALLSGADVEISSDKLPLDMLRSRFMKALARKRRIDQNNMRLEDAEREHIETILAATNGNKSEAARILGICRGKLYSKLGQG